MAQTSLSSGRGWAVLLLVLTLVGPAPATAGAPGGDEPSTERPVESSPEPGPFLGKRYRYDRMEVFERTAYDLVAIPAGVADWRTEQWAVFSGVMVPTFALMAPAGPSPDVRLDRWFQREFDPWFPDIWAMEYQIPFWTTVAVGGFGTWGIAAATDNDRLAQSMSLMGESVAVSQVYHLSLKLMTGREGPRDEQGLGLFHGPPGFFDYFPSGTPSGHFSTLYAMWGAAQRYWQFPVGWDVTGHVLLGSLASTHVITHRHYLSDIIAGSAMGYAIGQWVVRHRSTRYQYREGRAVRITILPRPRGFALSFQFTID